MEKQTKSILDLLKEFSRVKEEAPGNTLNISWKTIANGDAFKTHPKDVIDKWIKDNPYSSLKK